MSLHVLIAYTGGTIGMTRTAHGWGPEPGFLESLMHGMPELQGPDMPTYDVLQFDPLLDSSNMSPADWVRIAAVLDRHWLEGYDAFVVLHGTDTMAYTASALAMILAGLDRPVIMTGSQIPLCQPRNDGRENLVTALQIAGDPRAPREVCIYFGDRLLRGCRTTKVDSTGFHTFDSPNLAPLGTIGVRINFHVAFQPHLYRRAGSNFGPGDERRPPGEVITSGVAEGAELARVGLLKIYPGFPPEWLERVVEDGIRGLVLECYGVGNGPDRDPRFMEVLEQVAAEVAVVDVSQSARGPVNLDDYVTGSALKRAGIISGEDMTSEAALAKLFYLFQSGRTTEEARELLGRDLRGELTPRGMAPE